MQIGSAAPIPLTATQLDARRVELRASLANVPPGPAQIRFYEDDPGAGRAFETTAAVAIQPPPSEVDAKSAVASLGDAFISLTGSGLERIRGLLVNGVTYTKVKNATATSACFDGPPLGSGLAIGQHITAQLVTDANAAQPGVPATISRHAPSARFGAHRRTVINAVHRDDTAYRHAGDRRQLRFAASHRSRPASWR